MSDGSSAKRGRRPVRTEDAAAIYQGRTDRDADRDAFLGLIAATLVEVLNRFIRGAVAENRQWLGRRPTAAPDPVPAWCRAGLRRAQAIVAAYPGLQRHREWALLAHQAVEESLDALANGGEGLFASLSRAEAVLYRVGLVPSAEQTAARMSQRRRSEDTLQAFYHAVRMTWYVEGRGDPKASDLALLAAAVGIEPLEEGFDKARRTWENRLRRWPQAMDRYAPDWQRAAADLVHGEALNGLVWASSSGAAPASSPG